MRHQEYANAIHPPLAFNAAAMNLLYHHRTAASQEHAHYHHIGVARQLTLWHIK